LRLIAYAFIILQIFLYIIRTENYSILLAQLDTYNDELSQASNTGAYIGTFIASTFFFWVAAVLLYFDKKNKKH
jgi:hypothetical protein